MIEFINRVYDKPISLFIKSCIFPFPFISTISPSFMKISLSLPLAITSSEYTDQVEYNNKNVNTYGYVFLQPILETEIEVEEDS